MGSSFYIYKDEHDKFMQNKIYRERYETSLEYKVFKTKQAAKVDAYEHWGWISNYKWS